MRFKKIELIGFKSFANKTTIVFEGGVTAIVGPNGCGKSNISDAIRWVLGEQSAKSMRGSSMEDVIFNGSASAEALNLAEVSLTLTNEDKTLAIDYDEVTITRRLHRSGESEYLINKNTVRLRDIHELLMGTGIGTDSYAIIEQGKMDVILNSKPDDRRAIFEEAAGITKFKSKKKEALRKLEQTEQNLLRVNDIIQEVKRQISSVERQAKKAEAYKVEFESLRKLELSVASREFLLFETKRRDKEHSLDSLKEEEQSCAAEVQECEERCEEKRRELNEYDEQLKDQQTQEIITQGEIRRNQDRILLNRERIGELSAKKDSAQTQIETAKRRLEEFRAEYDNLNAEFEALSREETEGRQFLESVEQNFQAIETFLTDALTLEQSLKDQILDIANQNAHEQTRLAKLRGELSSFEHRLARLGDEEAGVRAEEEKSRTEMARFSETVQRLEAELGRRAALKQEKEAGLETLERRIHQGRESLEKISLDRSALQSRHEFLKDLNDRHEGFQGGVKALLTEKQNGSTAVTGMIGVLADLLKAETGYELAVEAALESYLQAVVFDTDENVLHAASYLRRERKGRAVLISLAYSSNKNISSTVGRPILEVLSVDAKVEGLVKKLLNGVFLVDDLSRAMAAAKDHPEIVCVTKDGERLEGQILMGGSLSENADLTLVGREAKLRSAEEELSRLSAAIEEGQTGLQNAQRDRDAAEEAVKQAAEQLLALQLELADEKGRLRHREEELQRISDRLDVFRLERSQLDGERTAVAAAEQEILNAVSALDIRAKQAADAMAASERSRADKAKDKEDLLVKLTETRSRQSHCVARREKIEKDRNWVLESKSNEENQVILFEKEIQESVQKKDTLENECANLEEELRTLAQSRDEIVEKIQTVKTMRTQSADALREAEAQKSEKEEFLKTSKDKLHSFEMEHAGLRFEIDRLKERIFNAYQMDLASAEGFGGEEEVDIEQAKQRIQELKDKLQKMGPVNLVAIQEHDEMKERYEFLTKQQADLVQAKEDLHKAILKINKTTKELFIDTFQKVQIHFTEYYRLLFGGGAAELVLLDEGDVLESGIEIIARPPGKKTQTISLLSGGEKALTAVALLFALFKVNPSPFCILDELDAPLDESNVDRFCNVLRDFIGTSQFILITHNKRTMYLADSMYGITMAQTGISRVVSVKFNENLPSDKLKELNKGKEEEVLV